MPRPPRVDHPGAWHHAMNRGARHQDIFVDDEDRKTFLLLLADTANRYALEVHGYALMSNHFHLLVRSLRGRLSEAMRHLQQTWTQQVNRRHGWDGPLFRGRFRSQLVQDDTYLLTVLAYLHLNPVVAGLAPNAESAPWTSHRAYINRESTPVWLHTDELLDRAGGAKGLIGVVNDLAHAPTDLGEELVDELQPRGPATGQVLATYPDAREAPDVGAVLAAITKLTGAELDALQTPSRGPKASPARRFAVWALRQGTELSQSEVAEVLSMSKREVQNVEARLKIELRPPLDGWVKQWTGRA